MSVERLRLSFEGHFTQVPNSWIRDTRLSRKARALVIEILSHREGWIVTERSLIAAGTEGREAVRSGIAELIEFGYIERDQERASDGRFGETRMYLVDPWADNPHRPEASPAVGKPVDGQSAAHIRTPIPQNTKSLEHQENTTARRDDFASVGDDFARWYAHYPRRVAKAAARKAYEAAARKIGADYAEVLRQGLVRFVHQMQAEGRDITKIAHPSTWLNQGRWEDEHTGVPRQMTTAERMAQEFAPASTDRGQGAFALEQ